MVLFMKNHPCHHSGGNARKYPDGYLFNGKPDPRSCAEKIIRYYHTVLRPNNTQLVIKVAWLYKAFWKFAVREDDKFTVNKSLEGLKLLLSAGIVVQGMKLQDWIILANMCSEPIKLQNLMLESRRIADVNTQKFIDGIIENNNNDETTQEEKEEEQEPTRDAKRVKTK